MTTLLSSLKQLKQDNSKYEVVIPAYTCYSVASAVINAGLKIRLCDVDPKTLSYNTEQLNDLPFDNVLCMITANLYGIPNQLNELEEIANANDIYLVDDAAQSFDASYAGRQVGTFGIAGLYSFDKGKNITSIDGGVLVTNNSQLADILENKYKLLTNVSAKHSLITALKVIIYYTFLNPYLYWLPASLPFLNLGKTRYEEKIEIQKYPANLAPLALKQIKRSKDIMDIRVNNGLWYKSKIQENKIVTKINEFNATKPAYLRYPLMISDPIKRNTLIVNGKRYGLTVSYPKSLNMLKEIQEYIVNNDTYAGAEQISQQIITLPTQMYIKNEDRKSINKLIYNSQHS